MPKLRLTRYAETVMKASGIVIALVILFAGITHGQDEYFTPKPRENSGSVSETCLFGLKRGIVNLTTCWIEIPRCLSYESTARPLSSPILGTLTGASYTGMRAIMGAIDLLSGGMNGYYSYSDFLPDFPWEGEWVSTKTEFD